MANVSQMPEGVKVLVDTQGGGISFLVSAVKGTDAERAQRAWIEEISGTLVHNGFRIGITSGAGAFSGLMERLR